MIDLGSFFRNPFSFKEVSDDELRKFTEHHIKMLKDHNENGQFTTMIAETENAYNGYFGQDRTKSNDTMMQQALEQRQKDIIKEFVDIVKRKERNVRYIANEISPVIYYEFFPSGMKEFDNVTTTNAEMLMNRMIDSANMHISDIGYEFLEHLKRLKAYFISVRDMIQRRADNPGDKPGNPYRRTLEIQLLRNLLTFAIVYISDPEDGITFFRDDDEKNSPDAETVRNSFMLRKQENQESKYQK